MSNYGNALVEVDTILNYLDEKEFQKIPPKVIKAIKLNKNDNYYYKLNDSFDLRNQPMLPETKAILFNLFRDYLSTSEQKEKIIKMQKEDRVKAREKTRQEFQSNADYNLDELFKRKKENSVKSITNKNAEATQMVKYEEKIFTKIINKIKSIFKIK